MLPMASVAGSGSSEGPSTAVVDRDLALSCETGADGPPDALPLEIAVITFEASRVERLYGAATSEGKEVSESLQEGVDVTVLVVVTQRVREGVPAIEAVDFFKGFAQRGEYGLIVVAAENSSSATCD
jgi:hypothetical protein